MNRNSFFKVLFWILTSAVFGFLCLVMLRIGFTITDATRITSNIVIGLGIPAILAVAIFTAISVFVYRDAAQRGMDRWMWMTIAVFIPNFIGLIIYFIVRSSNNTKCLSCGRSIRSEFRICPYCSTPLDIHCPQCGKQVLPDWKVCPYCRQDLQ